MRNILCFLFITFFLNELSAQDNVPKKSQKHPAVRTIISSKEGDRLSEKPATKFTKTNKNISSLIEVDDQIVYQKIDGFGASFNEAGIICLNALPTHQQDSVLKNLFDPITGSGFNIMKSPLAACDFSSAGPWYSYNDTPGDTLMQHFSIERDLAENGMIPYIKKAAKFGQFQIQTTMDFAPDWMMYGLNDGEKHVKPEYYRALARYYARYIQEYAANGVTIDYLNPFNEAQNKWYSNITYKEIGKLIKNDIVPVFSSEGISTKIQICETANRPEGIRNLPDILDDPEARKNIHSLTVHGYDWDKFSTLSVLHQRYPEFPIWMTEVCYAIKSNIPPNGSTKVPVYDFADGQFWGNMIMNDMKNHVSAWIYWNMILDENGGPWLISDIHGDPDHNHQQPVVVINRKTGEVSYTGLYYYLSHFSKFIKKGAQRINTTGGNDQLNLAAFKNPDGSITLNVINNGSATVCNIKWKDGVLTYNLPAHAIATFIW